MKTLIRSRITELYVVDPRRTEAHSNGPLHWTMDPDVATDFHFIDVALGFITKNDLIETELAFHFDIRKPETIVFSIERANVGFAHAQ